MGVSRNTSPVWCAACARSPPHARAPSVSAGSGPPPSGTTRGATAASQNASGFLQKTDFMFEEKHKIKKKTVWLLSRFESGSIIEVVSITSKFLNLQISFF